MDVIKAIKSMSSLVNKIVLFILFTALADTASAQQQISFNINAGWHLDKVLLELSKEAGINITFNPDDVKRVSVRVQSFNNRSLTDILDVILTGTSFKYKLNGNKLLIFKRPPDASQKKIIDHVIPAPAQENRSFIVSGRVVNESGTPMVAATVKLSEINQFFTTDVQGNFNMLISGVKNGGSLTFEVSYVGYRKFTQKINNLQQDTILPVISLKEMSLRLKDISVTANRNFEGSSNSSLMISREVIEQTPALSLNDLLNQIPNRVVSAPSLQQVQNITLRGSYMSTVNNKGAFELNNSFGVAIIMDGNVLSNNMNMQSSNPGRYGLSGSFLTSGTSYGLSGTGNNTVYTGDYAFGGIDLRQIPPDNIESIEVVSGVAAAKYGDLTDGAIIIERQAGISKGYFRTQLRDNATSYSFSKGFRLSEKAGIMNASLSYVNSYAEARDQLKAYSRINGNVIWTNFYGKSRRLKNTTIVDYGRNLDGIKRDPDDPASTKVRFDSWNFSVSDKLAYRINGPFIKTMSLNFRYSEGHQYSYRENKVNNAYVLYTNENTTGIHEGVYDKGIYTAQSIIDGRPVGFTASLDFNAGYNTGGITHFLTFGGNYNYGRNKGLGQVVDPAYPRATAAVSTGPLSSSRAERYYNFDRAVAQQDIGVYVEDIFKTMIAERYLHVRSGVRMDIQNGFISGSPRINANYEVNKALRIGLAYGVAYKSPALAQRYPGPTFIEIPVLNAYTGNVAESQALIYVQRYDASNKELRSSRNQTLELSAQYKENGFSMSMNIYSKWSRNGINTQAYYDVKELPVYTAEVQSGAKPIVTQTGTRKVLLTTHVFKNNLYSNSNGIELIVTSPKITAIATSLNLSIGFNRTHYKNTAPEWTTVTDGVNNTLDDYAMTGRYPSANYVTSFSNGRITSITHIPKIRLILQFIAECNFLQKTIRAAQSGIPTAYYTNALDFVEIKNFDKNNAMYGHLYKPESELNAESVPGMIMNYHLSVGKEIHKRFKFSFNVYNVFNYQPYYISSVGTYNFPNASPTFGAELSIKI